MKKNKFIYEISKNKLLYIMVFPVIIYFIIFSYIPMVGVYYAFTKFNFIGGLFGSPFIGLDNFRFLFAGGDNAIIWIITRNTLLYNFAFILIGNIMQILTAIILNELPGKYIKKTSQSITFLPYFISYVLVGVFIYNLFNYEYGVINNTLKGLGLDAVNFYGNPSVWKYIIVGAYLWKSLGYGTVIYLATIMGIDKSLYEAADIDGANIFQKINHITLPLLKPTFIILLLFSIGNILKGQFDLFYQIIGKNGLLYKATDIIDTYVYRSLVVNFDLGMGTAAGLYQSFFGLVLVLSINGIVRLINKEYALF